MARMAACLVRCGLAHRAARRFTFACHDDIGCEESLNGNGRYRFLSAIHNEPAAWTNNLFATVRRCCSQASANLYQSRPLDSSCLEPNAGFSLQARLKAV